MLTSVTPGTRASCGRTIQSMTVCRSVVSYGVPSGCVAPCSTLKMNMKISPRPVEIGPSSGSSSGGSVARDLLQAFG